MATGQTNPPPTPLTTPTQSRWSRRLAIVTTVVFVISSVFPLVAGLSKNTASFPEWWGTMDVAVALILAILAIALLGLVGGNVSKQVEEVSYRFDLFPMPVASFASDTDHALGMRPLTGHRAGCSHGGASVPILSSTVLVARRPRVGRFDRATCACPRPRWNGTAFAKFF